MTDAASSKGRATDALASLCGIDHLYPPKIGQLEQHSSTLQGATRQPTAGRCARTTRGGRTRVALAGKLSSSSVRTKQTTCLCHPRSDSPLRSRSAAQPRASRQASAFNVRHHETGLSAQYHVPDNERDYESVHRLQLARLITFWDVPCRPSISATN